MTEAMAKQDWCPEHERPISGCRHGVSLRMWGDTQREIAAAGEITAFLNEMAEAGLGFARCRRGHRVPVSFGNLDGMTLREAVIEAVDEVNRQKCRHLPHEPVTISAAQNPAPSVAPATPEPLLRQPAAS